MVKQKQYIVKPYFDEAIVGTLDDIESELNERGFDSDDLEYAYEVGAEVVFETKRSIVVKEA